MVHRNNERLYYDIFMDVRKHLRARGGDKRQLQPGHGKWRQRGRHDCDSFYAYTAGKRGANLDLANFTLLPDKHCCAERTRERLQRLDQFSPSLLRPN